jgi:hypothetical protein
MRLPALRMGRFLMARYAKHTSLSPLARLLAIHLIMRLLTLRMERFLMLVLFKKQALWYWHGRFRLSSSSLKIHRIIALIQSASFSHGYARCRLRH